MLVFQNKYNYFYEADFRLVKSAQPVEITPFHLFQLIGLSQPHNSHHCIQHCLDNDILMGVYKKPAEGQKAHLDLNLPGKLNLRHSSV